ncbi:hypothetical protein A9R05_42470 (plasmid) [Burkholderia sp. KK1]|nr:hypothetical protein A9R05_42470 [Burkholderia sp. KK1]
MLVRPQQKQLPYPVRNWPMVRAAQRRFIALPCAVALRASVRYDLTSLGLGKADRLSGGADFIRTWLR